MAIAAVLTIPGGTLQQYDDILRQLNFAPGGPGAPGGLYHWVTATDSGIRVTDVWRSRELFEAYYRDQVGPLLAKAGLPEPEVEVFEVHNYLTSGPEA
ncbi:hypothetical protein [Arthrobacter mobilis]|uniref:ABM domain-containing protein n=1 Tax=Arthrobacter mobilis TaxID=2724944 RepID=A0A7X6HH96_9MICC|nr:hypothetical protein [Arthrobacter mobilis]NKX56189.1 hypothetical protein [Arthrobacter mobilis]